MMLEALPKAFCHGKKCLPFINGFVAFGATQDVLKIKSQHTSKIDSLNGMFEKYTLM